MLKLPLTAGLIFGAVSLGYGAQLPPIIIAAKTITVYLVSFTDPLQATGGSGDAFDRENDHIGLVWNPLTTPSNATLATITPAKVSPDIQFVIGNPAILTASPLDGTGAVTNPAPQNSASLTLTLKGVTGATYGKTQLDDSRSFNVGPTVPYKSLQTFIFPAITGRVAFHILSDGNPSDDPGITPDQITEMFSQLPGQQNVNAIWSQVNMSFIMVAPPDQAAVGFSIAPMVITDPVENANEASLADFDNRDAHFDIFFVNKLLVNGTQENGISRTSSSCDGNGTLTAGHSTIQTHDANGNPIPLQTLSRIIAHELGHLMGLAPMGLSYRGQDLGIDTSASNLIYQLEFGATIPGVGNTVTPMQRDCVFSIQ